MRAINSERTTGHRAIGGVRARGREGGQVRSVGVVGSRRRGVRTITVSKPLVVRPSHWHRHRHHRRIYPPPPVLVLSPSIFLSFFLPVPYPAFRMPSPPAPSPSPYPSANPFAHLHPPPPPRRLCAAPTIPIRSFSNPYVRRHAIYLGIRVRASRGR